ncbi:unnamed protein product, partial [Tetraodon nigroviridis]
MEPHGSSSRADGDLLELEADEELLCSVSDIAEHLGRNLTAVLQAALSDIRKMVSIRIRVLKMELREKNQEIELLRAKLTAPGADAGPRKHHCAEPRRPKALLPGVKRENIDAICDYLMKDKNSRGCSDTDGEQNSRGSSDKEPRQEAEGQPLHLWPDGAMGGPGSAQGDSDSTAEDLFSIIPSGSRRMYDYEWMPPDWSTPPRSPK